MAQSLAAASRTVDPAKAPTNMHLQFLRGGAAGSPVEYTVESVFDGRTAAARRVDSRQDGRLLTTASVSFSAALAGPEHGRRASTAGGPEHARRDRTSGTRAVDAVGGNRHPRRRRPLRGEFVRRLWWRVKVPVPDEPLLHTIIAAYVTDVYMIDPALQVHGHSMKARTHRSGTTDSSIWFHRPIRADQWNLLETRSPAAARGRGVITGSLVGADGFIAATLVQEGLIAEREPSQG